ncbi:uncharacterized [Lates japonicus]
MIRTIQPETLKSQSMRTRLNVPTFSTRQATVMHLSVCVYEFVCTCIYSLMYVCASDQCSNKQTKEEKKINPQCRDSTSLSCLALWFPSLYSASVAGVSGTLRVAPLSLMLPYLNLQTYLLLPRLRFCRRFLPLSPSQVLLLTGIW